MKLSLSSASAWEMKVKKLMLFILISILCTHVFASNQTTVLIIDSPLDYDQMELNEALDLNKLHNTYVEDELGNKESLFDFNNDIKTYLENNIDWNLYSDQIELLKSSSTESLNKNQIAKDLFHIGAKPIVSSHFKNNLGLISIYLHGTHTASLAAKNHKNLHLINFPIHGIARPIPDMKHFESINYLNTVHHFYHQISKIIKENKVNIVNMSFESSSSKIIKNLKSQSDFYENLIYSQRIEKIGTELANIEKNEIEKLLTENPNTVFVQAVGNDRMNLEDDLSLPATIQSENLIKVTSLDQQSQLSRFSNYSEKFVDIGANGEGSGDGLNGALVGGGEIKFYGTSMAAPNVVHALVSVFNENPPTLTAVEAINKFYKDYTVEIAGLNHKIKNGRILNPKYDLGFNLK
jgi:hypothetical protein